MSWGINTGHKLQEEKPGLQRRGQTFDIIIIIFYIKTLSDGNQPSSQDRYQAAKQGALSTVLEICWAMQLSN